MQVGALRGRLEAGRGREAGLLGLLAGVAAVAVPRLGPTKFGTLLRACVLVKPSVPAAHHVFDVIAVMYSIAQHHCCRAWIVPPAAAPAASASEASLCCATRLPSRRWQVLAAANSVVGLANYAWCYAADGRPAAGGLGVLSRQPANAELPLQLLI